MADIQDLIQLKSLNDFNANSLHNLVPDSVVKTIQAKYKSDLQGASKEMVAYANNKISTLVDQLTTLNNSALGGKFNQSILGLLKTYKYNAKAAAAAMMVYVTNIQMPKVDSKAAYVSTEQMMPKLTDSSGMTISTGSENTVTGSTSTLPFNTNPDLKGIMENAASGGIISPAQKDMIDQAKEAIEAAAKKAKPFLPYVIGGGLLLTGIYFATRKPKKGKRK